MNRARETLVTSISTSRAWTTASTPASVYWSSRCRKRVAGAGPEHPQIREERGVKIYVASELDPAAELKFDSTSDNGTGDQIKVLNELCPGTSKKVKTGETQSFTLTLDDARKERIANGGRLCLDLVPADSKVAATYFGANENDKGSSPKLTMRLR
jgi:hypothetical protein